MSAYKKFTKDVGVTAVSEAILRFKPILFLPIITKAFGPSDYGVYATLLVTISFFGPISKLGLNFSAIRLLAAEKDKSYVSQGVSATLIFTIISSSLMAVLMFVFSDLLAQTVFGNPESSNIIKIGALLLPLTQIMDQILSFFRLREEMRALAIFRISENFLPLALAAVFVYQGLGLLYVVYAYIIVEIFLITVSLPLSLRGIGLSLPNLRMLGPYISFGAPLVLLTLSTVILNVGDRYVIGLLMNSSAIGIYSVAYNLGCVVLVFLSPIGLALLTPLSKAYDTGMSKQVRTYLSYSVRYFLLFSIPAAVGISVLAASAIKSLTTSEFAGGSIITPLIAFSNVALGLYTIISRILLLQKKSGLLGLMLGAFAVINILLNFLMIPSLGLFGAAFSTLICFVALFATTVQLTNSHINVPIEKLFLLKCSVASLIMGAFVLYMKPTGWVAIGLVVVMAVLIYFALLHLFRTFKKQELDFFRSFLTKQEVYTQEVESA